MAQSILPPNPYGADDPRSKAWGHGYHDGRVGSKLAMPKNPAYIRGWEAGKQAQPKRRFTMRWSQPIGDTYALSPEVLRAARERMRWLGDRGLAPRGKVVRVRVPEGGGAISLQYPNAEFPLDRTGVVRKNILYLLPEEGDADFSPWVQKKSRVPAKSWQRTRRVARDTIRTLGLVSFAAAIFWVW